MKQTGKSRMDVVVWRTVGPFTSLLCVGGMVTPALAQTQSAASAEVAGGAVTTGEAEPAAVSGESVTTSAEVSEPQTKAATPAEVEASEAAAAEPTTLVVPEYAGVRAREGYSDPASGQPLYPYILRYKPQRNQWEVSLFVGALFPSEQHNLKVPTLPVDLYSKSVVQLGFRVAYFPLSFVGLEFQSFLGGGSLQYSGYSAAFYGLSGHLIAQLPLASIVPFATIGVGTLGAISETMGHDRDPAFIWGAGVKGALSRRIDLRLDFQDTLTQKRDAKNGKQTHHPAIQLGVTFVFEREVERLPRTDVDYDGLFDVDDKCPRDGALTVDGCPVDEDTDGDGFLDSKDTCPKEAGIAPDGCPDLDIDKDGVPLPEDQCPEESGPAPTGCADPDPDKDGISGPIDQCPTGPETKNGYEDRDGCPDEMPEEVKRFTGVIPGITFKQGTAVIETASHPTLDAAAKILGDYPSVELEVSGHTSSEGAEKRNQELSVQRAEAVKQYFVGKGIAAERLSARGAGASEPVADNATKEGREKNRRIEFRVLSQP